MAVQVHNGIFVGNGSDTYKFAGSILHCARDPWFESARLRSGATHIGSGWTAATGRIAAHQQSLAIRESYNEMVLNMVDADDAKYFSDEMVNAGLEFITERLAEGDPVLVHCNMGISRSPSMAMLWMFEHGFLDDEFRYAVPKFKDIYPSWMPANGIWQYLKARCENKCENPSTSVTSS